MMPGEKDIEEVFDLSDGKLQLRGERHAIHKLLAIYLGSWFYVSRKCQPPAS